MTNKLMKLMDDMAHQDFAMKSGTDMHAKLKKIFFDVNGGVSGDADIAAKLAHNKELIEYMGPLSRTEVPIAGYLDARFKSLRIDRLYLNDQTKQIVIIDYKTDLDKEKFHREYIAQLKGYQRLLTDAYPGFSVAAKILWLNDFTLENVV